MADDATRAGRPLDPEGHYGPEDLEVGVEVELPGREAGARPGERLPAREVLYGILREYGPMSLADLARHFTVTVPGGVRPPYTEDPEVYVLRLVAGRRAGRALSPMEDLVRGLAEDPQPDPDYGFVVRPA